MIAGPTRRPSPEVAAVLRLAILPESVCECRETRWHAPGNCGTDYTCASTRGGDRICGSCFCNCADDSARQDGGY